MQPTTQKQEPRKLLISLEKIKTYDRSLQVRGEVDLAKVEEYRQIIKDNGGAMDAIKIFEDSTAENATRWIADGFHRIDAYTLEGIDKIPVFLRVGTKSEALRFALGENGHHGAPMTNAMKRHAAEMAVLDPELGEKTDQDIARLIGCSPSLVNACRRGETAEAATGKAKERAAKQQAPKPDPKPDPTPVSGKRETESPAPPPVVSHERKPADAQPTKAMLMKQVSAWIERDQISEDDLLEMMASPSGKHRFLPKDGSVMPVKIVGKSGRVQFEGRLIIKDLVFDGIVLRNEGPKIQAVEAEE